MTSRFLSILGFVFKWEGGYDNDPDDPGGETKYGIDKRSHPDVDIKNLTKDGAAQIYFKEYWSKFGCEFLPYPLGEVYFNTCVNCGKNRADKIKKLSHDASSYIDELEAFYVRLVAFAPTSRKYLRGWLNRSEDIRHFLGLKQQRKAA